MKIIVCGGRYFGWSKEELWFIYQNLYDVYWPNNDYVEPDRFRPSPHTLVSGECKIGTDVIAKYFAKLLYNINYDGVPADWSRGRSAGPIRNTKMLNKHKDADLVFAFPGGNGTNDTIKKAKKMKIPCKEYEYTIPYKELEKQRKGKMFPWKRMNDI